MAFLAPRCFYSYSACLFESLAQYFNEYPTYQFNTKHTRGVDPLVGQEELHAAVVLDSTDGRLGRGLFACHPVPSPTVTAVRVAIVTV